MDDRNRPSRRAFVAAAALVAGCGRRKGTGYPGYAYVATAESPSLAAIDLTSFSLAGRIPLPGLPVQVTAGRGAVYALEGGRIHEVRDRTLRRTAHVGAQTAAMRVAPGGDRIWVLCREPRHLVRLRLDTLQAETRVTLPGSPEDFDLDRDGKRAAVCFRNARGVALVGARGVERWIPTASQPRIVRFQSDGRQVIAGDRERRTVTIADVASGRVVVNLPLAIEPVNFCMKPDGGELYISGPGMDAVAIVFPYNTEVGETVLAGKSPGAMAVAAAPLYLFVANPETGDVTVLDLDTRKLVSVVHTGGQPSGIVITPDNQYALVLNRASGDVAVIRIAALGEFNARRYKHAPLFTIVPVGRGPSAAVVV